MLNFNTNKSVFIKFISLLLVLLIALPLISACKARPVTQTKPASEVVGNVGKYSVLYEELYILANQYTSELKSNYADNPEALKNAVWEKINENITANYAILTLCEKEGLVYDEKALKEDVEREIELQIENSFEGSRSKYFKSQKQNGLTDHYWRFVLGVDILYSRLETKYRSSGVVPNTDEKLLNHINENFVHTNHIAIFVNDGDDYNEKLQKAKDALAELENGTTMFELVGSKYNEAVLPESLKDAYGYYFPRGVMDKAYEDAAFSLNVGGHSGIIEGMGENNNGKTVKCFYIIERWAMDDAEIDANFNTLSDLAVDSIIYEKVENVKSTLSFAPNSYAKSLDITILEPVKNGFDYILVIGITLSVLACAAIVVGIIMIRRAKTKRFHQNNKLSKRNI